MCASEATLLMRLKLGIDSHNGSAGTSEKAFVTGRNETAFSSPQALSSCG